MKKFIAVLLMLVSINAFSEASKSISLEQIPSSCDPRIIISEIPMIMNEDTLESGEVLDVTNIQIVEQSANRLVCVATLVNETSSLTGRYKISFTQNSMGDVIVSY